MARTAAGRDLRLATALIACLAIASPAAAAEIKVWSAGAVEPGLIGLVDAFNRETGDTAKLTVAVPAVLRQRIEAGETPDVLIAPPSAFDPLVQAGKVDDTRRAVVGRVGVGVIVRQGAPVPDISSPDAFAKSLLAAERVVYNRASTGIYLERLLERLGITAQIAPKSVRYPDGVGVMKHVLGGSGDEVGVGAITEIRAFEQQGLRYVGPLPAAIQNYTSYVAGVTVSAQSPDAGASFIKFITTPRARAVFAATGVE